MYRKCVCCYVCFSAHVVKGAKNVSGNYVVCVDSDDWIEDTYFEELVNAREKTGVDLVIANLSRNSGQRNSIKNFLYCSS